MRARLFIVCLFFCAVSSLWALDPAKTISQYSIRVWNMESGLPGNSIFALRQTADGYLWIGTQDGLARFDGLTFELFNKRNTPQLKCNIIRSLFEDREGNLWIGTTSGGLVRYRHAAFVHYPISRCPALTGISDIGQDRDGAIWIGSSTNGLAHFDNGKFFLYTERQGLPDNRVRSICRGPDGNLQVATQKGLAHIDRSGNVVTSRTTPLSDAITTMTHNSRTAATWIGTMGKGLLKKTGRSTTRYTTANGLPHPIVTSLLTDQRENLWIGTDGGGLTRMAGDIFSTLRSGNGLACGYVYSLLEDREGSLWVGTLDGGLHQLRDSKFTTFTTREGLANDTVHCVFQDNRHITWIGTRGGLNRYDGVSLSAAPQFSGKAVMSVCQGPDNAIWVGTWSGLYQAPNGDISRIRRISGLRDQRIRCLTTDGPITWIGTEGGLCRYSAAGTRWYDATAGLAGNSIQFIRRDRNGALWIGSDKGIDIIEGETISRWNPGVEGALPFAYCLHEDNDGIIWLGTGQGLLRVEGRSARLFNDRSGLVDNHVYSILEDDTGHLWLAGRYGISRVPKGEFVDFSEGRIDALDPETFNEKQGMKSRWCTGSAGKTNDGRFWFPTSIGISVIAPDNIKKNPLPPTPVIEKIIANGEAIPIPTTSATTPRVELSPGKKRLEFHYTAISFIDPQQITFKLRLEGYDDVWIDMGTVRHTTYTALPPGDYTFQITAANHDGTGNPVAVTLPVRLNPYFYQTTWFLFAIIFFSLFLAVFAYRFRIRQLRTQQAKLKTLVEQRTGELRESNNLIEAKNRQLEIQSEQLKELDEAKSRFFANISHEFRTPLTLIMGPLEQLITDYPDKRIKSKASLMLRNSRRLLGLVNQLLELARIDSGKTRLEATVQNLVPFIRSIVDCFQPLAQQNNIHLSFQPEDDRLELPFDQEKLEKVISNLLSNAFRHTPSGGAISVSIQMPQSPADDSGSQVEIIVKDTGSGIQPEELPNIFDRFYRGQSGRDGSTGSGIGLSLSKELVELHRGSISVQSDCSDGPRRGTEFVITLPAEELRSGDPLEVTPEPGPEPIPAGRRDRPLILVVEDNTDMRRYIKASMESSFDVAEAVDGEEGIQRARQLIPDLVISDIMMPKTDGYTLCRNLKNDILTSHVPIILLTAKSEESHIIEGLDAGADDYLTKPFNTAQLRQRSHNLILLRRQHQWEKKNGLALRPETLPASPIDDSFFDSLQTAIDTHIKDPDFNVDALSKLLDMSQSTLYRKIQGLTGQSPNRFIRSFRIRKAARLLETGGGNISDVAASVGFQDKSYFSKCFKEEYQYLPSSVKASSPNETESERQIVLVVEDDTDTRQYIREALEREFDVHEAKNGDEGFSLAQTLIPDLVVSDVMMPQTNGFELCALLKNAVQTSHIPVILLTARASDDSKLKGLENQADDYITKPFNANILQSRINNLIRLRGHMQDKRKRQLHNLPQEIKETAIDQSFAKELDDVIQKNIADQDFNVAQLANKLFISEATLYRKVLALTGQSPSHYLRSHRLKIAAELIKKDRSSITDIAFAVGFSSHAYFTRCFKEQFHQLPSNYE